MKSFACKLCKKIKICIESFVNHKRIKPRIQIHEKTFFHLRLINKCMPVRLNIELIGIYSIVCVFSSSALSFLTDYLNVSLFLLSILVSFSSFSSLNRTKFNSQVEIKQKRKQETIIIVWIMGVNINFTLNTWLMAQVSRSPHSLNAVQCIHRHMHTHAHIYIYSLCNWWG